MHWFDGDFEKRRADRMQHCQGDLKQRSGTRGFTKRDRVPSAFTLIEVLVVLLILSLCATMIAVRFSGPLRKQRVATACEHWKSLDQLARLRAQDAELTLEFESDAHSLVAMLVRNNNEVIRRQAFVAPIQLSVVDSDGNEQTRLRFRQANGTIDYRVVVREANVVREISFAGGSGQSIETTSFRQD